MHQVILEDRWATNNNICNMRGLSYDASWCIWTEHLNIWQIAAIFVPQSAEWLLETKLTVCVQGPAGSGQRGQNLYILGHNRRCKLGLRVRPSHPSRRVRHLRNQEGKAGEVKVHERVDYLLWQEEDDSQGVCSSRTKSAVLLTSSKAFERGCLVKIPRQVDWRSHVTVFPPTWLCVFSIF
jgi:hypothetical protein